MAGKQTSNYEWHDELLNEKDESILDCLASERIISVVKTEKGIQLVEMCDAYYGCTLSPEQSRRFIAELQALLDEA